MACIAASCSRMPVSFFILRDPVLPRNSNSAHKLAARGGVLI